MHVLAIDSGTLDTGDEAVDLGQTPGDIVVLSAADTELTLLARANANVHARSPAALKVRLANVLKLKHNFSVDLYADQVLAHAKLIVVRLLGGRSYWTYGLDRLRELAKQPDGPMLVVLPGDDKPDPSLSGLSTVPDATVARLHAYLVEGGLDNAERFLTACAATIMTTPMPLAATPIPRALIYDTREAAADVTPVGHAAVIFYRAFFQAGDTAAIDTLLDGLSERGLSATAFAVPSLRDTAAETMLRQAFADVAPSVVINTTAFATQAVVQHPTDPSAATTVFGVDAPWFQAVLSSQSREAWADNIAGLAPRDVAMHVSLPEFDGRILTRAFAFRAVGGRDPLTELPLTLTLADADRTAWVADLAAAWSRLRATPAVQRRVGIVLANYPNKDARLANGVGLDTPQSVVETLRDMASEGYAIDGAPVTSDALIARLTSGVTNKLDALDRRDITERLPLADYAQWYKTIPEAARAEIEKQWGAPAADPFVRDGAFAIAAHTFGNVVVAIQPARGYNIDPKDTYHDPALVPPHSYLAFYVWLRASFGADAVVHFGKHGNLEWLPGKALALSDRCWPDIALGCLPNIYPFIVNDPGEGAQAKRRTAAVVIDHLMPPITQAETYGPLRDLEVLVDEYYEAQSVDRRRSEVLVERIIETAERLGLDADAAIHADATTSEKLQQLDAYLCDLKEMQIRGGLHVFGREMPTSARADTLAAIARVPRGPETHDGSITTAIAADLKLLSDAFDPLDCEMSRPWTGPRPEVLVAQTDDPWRSYGDTVERLALLAAKLIAAACPQTTNDLPARLPTGMPQTETVLRLLGNTSAVALDASPSAERAGLLTALDGRLVAPGPSGAPTRGRADILPTGRNFYSLDSRSLPTETAWELGRKAADALVQRYAEDHGDWPTAIVMSAWGTSNMRTGGDDLAQVIALLGARPTWDRSSRRVTGFEVLPLAALGRPRVDVTLRISGFFRDAFPTQIALIDSIVRAVAARDEPADDNPLAARVAADRDALLAAGHDVDDATRQATFRVFGSQPGAYGAGLQAMLDEGLWQDGSDLADAFLTWGQYAYGSDTTGRAARGLVEQQLTRASAILHNQDNREHDILDSDDYYQFAGGLAVAAGHLQGRKVPVYHGDNARPETPKVRALSEEIGRVVRARAVNPKWLNAMRGHGYKGAFEMAATVDYLFAFAATTGAVSNQHFDAIYEAYLEDADMRAFLDHANPDARADIEAKLREAIDRGLWQPRRNSTRADLIGIATAPKIEAGPKTVSR